MLTTLIDKLFGLLDAGMNLIDINTTPHTHTHTHTHTICVCVCAYILIHLYLLVQMGRYIPPHPHKTHTHTHTHTHSLLSTNNYSVVLFIVVAVNGLILHVHILFCFMDASLSEGWTISGTPLDLRDPRLLAMAAAERHLLEAEYDDYADTNASGAAFCRSAALIVSHKNHFLN